MSTSTPSTSKGKSVTIVSETPQSAPIHRAQFIPFSPSSEQQQQQQYALYQHQLSMSSQSTGDQNLMAEMSMASSPPPPHAYDSYYPYTSGYSIYSGGSGQVSMSPPPLPPPVSTLIAASALGSAPAMSSTAAKAHCTRAAAITASASHAISAAASSSSSQDKVHVPISLCLMILVAYVSGGGFLFSIWEEDWGYLEGSYFCFISLSTIGFGDLVPGAAVVAGEGGSQERLIICSLYLLTGLALIAMCFNLMQEEVIHKIRRIGQNLGIIKDPDLEAEDSDEDEDEEEDEDADDDENSDNNQLDPAAHGATGGVMSSMLGELNVDQVTSSGRANASQHRHTYTPSYHESPMMRSGAAAADASIASNVSPLSMARQYPLPPAHFAYPSVAYSSSSPPPPVTPSPLSMTPGTYGGPGMMMSPMMYPQAPPPPPFAQLPSSPVMQSAFPPYNWPTSGPS